MTSVNLPLMIGVVHRDPAGEDRLTRVLRLLQPELLTLEVSPYAVEFRQEHGEVLLAKLDELTSPFKAGHGQIEAIRETLKLPFEVRAAQNYANGNHCRVELVDDSEVSRRLLSVLESELLTKDNIVHLSAQPDVPLSRTVDSFYRRTRRLLATEPVPPSLLGFSVERLALLQVRDDRMSGELGRVRESLPDARWVHVGGVFHLLRVRGLTLLWEQLARHGMERAFLDELSD